MSVHLSQRFGHVDGLRGLAALLVMLVHYLAAFYPYSIFGEAESYVQHAPWESSLFIPPFGLLTAAHTAVCVFFVISGYVLTYKYLGERLRLWEGILLFVKRPIRLGGLVCFSLIIGAVFWACGVFQNEALVAVSSSDPWALTFWKESFAVSDFLADLFLAPFSHGDRYNPVLWTIKYELYGSFQLFAFLMLFSGWRFRFIPAGMLLVCSYESLYQGFWMGMVFADLSKNGYLKRFELWRLKRYVMVMTWLVFLYIGSFPNYVTSEFLSHTYYGWLPNDDGLQGGYPMLAATLLFFLVCQSTGARRFLTSKPMLHLGWLSYGVYISHLFVIFTVSGGMFLMLEPLWGYGYAFVASLMIGMPVVYISSLLMILYVDRPAVALSRFLQGRLQVIINYYHCRLSKGRTFNTYV